MSSYNPFLRAFLYVILFTLVLGIGYPLIITGVAFLLFPIQSHGSLVLDNNGVVTGSELIGMNFTCPKYFMGRPRATTGDSYNASSSGGSNSGPTSVTLITEINKRILEWRNRGLEGDIPSDLVMASGSGLDPDISLDSALIQVPLVAKARNISPAVLESLVLNESKKRPPVFSGRYVNVFSLNMAILNLTREK